MIAYAKASVINAEGAGLEPANALTRTAVFKTAALPIMLTFQTKREQDGN
jgi:hypothetical protein